MAWGWSVVWVGPMDTPILSPSSLTSIPDLEAAPAGVGPTPSTVCFEAKLENFRVTVLTVSE